MKKILLSLVLLVVLVYSGIQIYQFIDREFCVAEELPLYHVGPHPDDDTLRVVVMGDSWAELHIMYNGDTLFQQYGGRLTTEPIKCMTRGTLGAKSKDVYYYMFRSQTQEDSICTQSLLEEHPDYCIVMVGINDVWKKRPVSYYTGNYRLIIRLLLANDIRPVVMEIPDFALTEWLKKHGKHQGYLYRVYSVFTGVIQDDITPFRNGLREMLEETGLGDSVLFIPADRWLPQNHQYSEKIYRKDHTHLNCQGYHLLDSCVVSEIIRDYNVRTKYGTE